VASCGVDLAVELEEWQECLFFLFFAALSFLRDRGAAYVLYRPRGLGYVLSSSTCCVPLQTSAVAIQPPSFTFITSAPVLTKAGLYEQKYVV
jgi:hypothetical protein